MLLCLIGLSYVENRPCKVVFDKQMVQENISLLIHGLIPVCRWTVQDRWVPKDGRITCLYTPHKFRFIHFQVIIQLPPFLTLFKSVYVFFVPFCMVYCPIIIALTKCRIKIILSNVQVWLKGFPI